MKKFSILFTLILFVSSAFGQLIPLSTFDTNVDGLLLGSNVASAALNTSTPNTFTATGCVGGSRILSGTTATISITITPVSGLVILTDLALTLKHDQNAQTTGTATVTVNGNAFGTSQTFNNSCTVVIFTDVPVSVPIATIDINVVYNNNSSKDLTIDDIIVDGSVQLAVLPIELSKFNVKKTEQSVMISWATASEKNNKHFEIQKSTNGTQFQTIGQVKGSGTNLSGAVYNFEDKTPSVGVSYYRLKQVDTDGTYAYTTVRSILFGKSKIAVVSTIAKERISLTVSDDQIVPFDIINLNGQTVLAGKAIGQHTIDISGLNSGMYFIRTEGGEVTRFVKD